MTNRVAITLTDEQKARLEQIAAAREETLVATVQEAVAEYLDYDAEFRKAVQEGLDDVAAGRTRPWTDVKAELRAKYGVPKA
jgi:predicted transcriptional regulator